MKVRVTGGAGFIDSNLMGCLVRDDHQVAVQGNLSPGYSQNPRRLSAHSRHLIGCAMDAESSVMGAVRLLDAARDAGGPEAHSMDLDTPYGVSKLCAEKETQVYSNVIHIFLLWTLLGGLPNIGSGARRAIDKLARRLNAVSDLSHAVESAWAGTEVVHHVA